MDQNELNEILRKHQLWLDGKEGGERANLAFANLAFANLEGATLEGANFYGRKAIHSDLSRNYILYVLPEVKNGPRFIAGCRNFNHEKAIEHWSTKSNQPEYVNAIKTYMAIFNCLKKSC